MQAFEADPDTDAIVMLSEVGGGKDHEAAEYISGMKKPVVGMIIGSAVPVGKAMGHAGAMVSCDEHTVSAKRARLEAAGARMVDQPEDIPAMLKGVM